jgi:hypothetical protein
MEQPEEERGGVLSPGGSRERITKQAELFLWEREVEAEFRLLLKI